MLSPGATSLFEEAASSTRGYLLLFMDGKVFFLFISSDLPWSFSWT